MASWIKRQEGKEKDEEEKVREERKRRRRSVEKSGKRKGARRRKGEERRGARASWTMAPCRGAMGTRGVKACVVFSRPLEDVSRLASSIRLTKGNHRGVDRMRDQPDSYRCVYARVESNQRWYVAEFGQRIEISK